MDNDELLLDACIDTYRIIILDTPLDDIISERGEAALLFDPEDVEDMTPDDAGLILSIMLTVFEEHEHYEKCQDIMEYIDAV